MIDRMARSTQQCLLTRLRILDLDLAPKLEETLPHLTTTSSAAC
ncbi:MAG: hypothetical protein ACI9N0_003612 [Ilumatobacter sp.]